MAHINAIRKNELVVLILSKSRTASPRDTANTSSNYISDVRRSKLFRILVSKMK